jgi:hypothetical protein
VALDTCDGNLTDCQADFDACTVQLTTTEGELTQCQTDLADCQAASGSSFPATGQTTCWNYDTATGQWVEDPNCTNPFPSGQDGDIRSGAELSYTETAFTIIDNNTKLEWMKQDDNNGDCASYPGNLDKDCEFNWLTAYAFVATLNAVEHAGYNDWRLPNVKELVSIVNYENDVAPTVSAEFNSGPECETGCSICSCISLRGYWSSTAYAISPEWAWGVSFNSGLNFATDKTDRLPVRAVRGGL